MSRGFVGIIGWLGITMVVPTVVGCSTSDGSDAGASSPSSIGSPSSSSTSDTLAIEKLGAEVRTPRGSTVTVHSWRTYPRPGPPATGEWYAADTEFCLTPEVAGRMRASTLENEFRADLADGSQLTPKFGAETPREVYADSDRLISPNECLRGLVVFDVPRGQQVKDFALSTPDGWLRWPVS